MAEDYGKTLNLPQTDFPMPRQPAAAGAGDIKKVAG